MLVAATGPVERSLRRPMPTNIYFGRWTVAEPPARYTARGLAYKTIDIASCGPAKPGGRDFCGVSVATNGTCGAVLFRFLGRHARGDDTLTGRGLWGTQRKTIQIENWGAEGEAGGRQIELYLGDGHSFGGRSDNMPRFHAIYGTHGRAQCVAR